MKALLVGAWALASLGPPAGAIEGPDLGESSTVQAAGGGAPRGDWALELSAGFPWQRLRGQVGVGRGFTVVGEFETALGRRFWPAAGVGYRMADHSHLRITGEAMLGWLVQTTPELRKRGFAPMLRVRVASPWGRRVNRWIPHLELGMRPAILMDRSVYVGARGERTQWTARSNLTLWGSLGLAVAINEHVGVDIGIDLPWVDVPAISIPGFHVGLYLGGWGR